MRFRLRQTTEADAEAVCGFIRKQWGDDVIIVHGVTYHPDKLQGFVAEVRTREWVGLATYNIENSGCELVTLDSIVEGEGIGTALVKAVAEAGSVRGCTRLWCVTTNDNLPALEFYQKRGFRIVAVYPGAVERARVLKPSIPLYGIESIPIRDEIELEIQLHSIPAQ
jgi:GNAT superfamily N-acetyltransferase